MKASRVLRSAGERAVAGACAAAVSAARGTNVAVAITVRRVTLKELFSSDIGISSRGASLIVLRRTEVGRSATEVAGAAGESSTPKEPIHGCFFVSSG